jgi:HSP20 family molecular chaperone IbpA
MATEMTKTAGERREDEGRETTRGVPVYRPLADIREDAKGGVVLTLEMPGVGAGDVDIDVERRMLTIRGRGRIIAPEGYRRLYAEYGEGDYERAFTLSEEIDEGAIRAEMANGVLTLTLPRAEAARPRRIEVKAG